MGLILAHLNLVLKNQPKKINTVHSLLQKIPFKFEIIIFARSSISCFIQNILTYTNWAIFAGACFYLNPSPFCPAARTRGDDPHYPTEYC